MSILAIFNPEHDLCLANGNRHYVPPASALRFAEEGAWMMRALYDCTTATAATTGRHYRMMADKGQPATQIVAWGWDNVLKEQLLKQGIPHHLLPSDHAIDTIRSLSHRTTALPLQHEAAICTSASEVEDYLQRHRRTVLKAPLSGSGRGLRWIDHTLSDNDRHWIAKTAAEQGCVVAEPRYEVVQDFAIELTMDDSGVHDRGDYSLFETQNGVYRGNRMLYDDEIEQRLSQYIAPTQLHQARKEVARWIAAHLATYRGPIGVDMFIYRDDSYHLNPCVEINLRHTMGMVAHSLLQQHSELHGTLWKPMPN